MQTEYEATFTDIDKDDVREKLQVIGAELARPEFMQKRVNYTVPKESSYYAYAWLRVRDESDKVTMSLKAVENTDGIESQKEICLDVKDIESAKDFLEALGCVQKAYQESKREIWIMDCVEVCIDEWPWLEPFVEIEGSDEESVRQVVEKLGFDYDEALFGAVDAQYEKKFNVTKEVINNNTPRFVFGETCPFMKSDVRHIASN